MKLLIATRNPHKLEEIKAIFPLPGLHLVSALDFPDLPDVVEDGLTLEANAIKKAREWHAATGLPALADDTGLEVDALGGQPGVWSARYAGEPVDYHANNRKLLHELQHAPTRTARFRSILALAGLSATILTVEGRVEGTMATAPRGTHGFGYDPLFIPEGHTRTFAEMTGPEKNQLSHRARALAAAHRAWLPLLSPPRSPCRGESPKTRSPMSPDLQHPPSSSS
ncbi:MAG TPA: RdgB/HAM1 family non-canonical purine NTP pyrophosphatase [Kiritimatiellia bacterium]|nr:RdgB/HAM1 family non-canonical purine NTP pyrophosphatase [Kiritimatiellia bacterium]